MIGTIILVIGLVILLLAIIGVITTLVGMTKPGCIEGGFFYYILFIFSKRLAGVGLLITLLGIIVYAVQHVK